MYAWGSRSAISHHKRCLRIVGFLRSYVINAAFPVLAQKVEAQAVGLSVNHFDKFVAQPFPLGWFEQALEYGILNSLTPIHAYFRDAPEAASSFGRFRVHIVCDHNQHIVSLPEKGRVGVKIAPQVA